MMPVSILDKYVRYSKLPDYMKIHAVEYFGTYQKAAGYAYNVSNGTVLTEAGDQTFIKISKEHKTILCDIKDRAGIITTLMAFKLLYPCMSTLSLLKYINCNFICKLYTIKKL